MSQAGAARDWQRWLEARYANAEQRVQAERADAPLNVFLRPYLDAPLPRPTQADWLAWMEDELQP